MIRFAEHDDSDDRSDPGRSSSVGSLDTSGRDELVVTLTGRTWLISSGLLLLSSVMLYSPMFDNGFMLDDYLSLKNAYFGTQRFSYAAGPWFPGFMRPLSQLLFTWEYELFGFRPFGYYAANLILHLVNTALVVLASMQILRHHGKALLAGLLFAVGWAHHGKGIIWISDAFGLFATLLYLVALLGYLTYLRRRSGGYLAYGISVAAFAAATFAKESTLSLFIVLTLATFFLSPDRGGRRVKGWLLLAPHLLVLGAYGIVVITSVESAQLGSLRASDVPRAILDVLRYHVLALFPIQSSPLAESGSGPWRLLLAVSGAIKTVMALGVAAFIAWIFRRGSDGYRFLTLAPLAAVLPFTAVPQEEGWLNLRYLYLPSVFLSPLAGACIVDMVTQRVSRVMRLAGVVLPIFFVLVTTFLMRRLEERYDGMSYQIESLDRLREDCGGELVPPGEEPAGDAEAREPAMERNTTRE